MNRNPEEEGRQVKARIRYLGGENAVKGGGCAYADSGAGTD